MKMIGYEKDYKWEVEECVNPTTISLWSPNDELLESVVYTCEHEPIFGFDCWDVYKINEILNALIQKHIG